MYVKEYNNDELNSIGVYRIITPSGGIYVGMTTVSFKERWKQHCNDLKNNKHPTVGLKNVYKKYDNWNVFSLEILKMWSRPVEQHELLSVEKEIILEEKLAWIRHKNSGYNMLHGCPTGTGSVQHTAETKLKIGQTATKSLIKKYKNLGITPRNILSEEERKLIQVDYENGLLIKDIIIKYNKSRNTIYTFLKESKFDKPNRRDINYANIANKYPIEKWHFEDGLSNTEIAKLTGYSIVHISRVVNFLKRTNTNLDDCKAQENNFNKRVNALKKMELFKCVFCDKEFKKNVIPKHEKACYFNPINFVNGENVLIRKCCYLDCQNIVSSFKSKTCKEHNFKGNRNKKKLLIND